MFFCFTSGFTNRNIASCRFGTKQMVSRARLTFRYILTSSPTPPLRFELLDGDALRRYLMQVRAKEQMGDVV